MLRISWSQVVRRVFLQQEFLKRLRQKPRIQRFRVGLAHVAIVERLEDRAMLSAVTWTGSGDGSSWSDHNNWSTGAVPEASSDVTLNAPSGATIYGPAISTIVKSLKIDSAN